MTPLPRHPNGIAVHGSPVGRLMRHRIPRERINTLLANSGTTIGLSVLNLARICDGVNMAAFCHEIASAAHHDAAIFLDENPIDAPDRKDLTTSSPNWSSTSSLSVSHQPAWTMERSDGVLHLAAAGGIASHESCDEDDQGEAVGKRKLPHDSAADRVLSEKAVNARA